MFNSGENYSTAILYIVGFFFFLLIMVWLFHSHKELSIVTPQFVYQSLKSGENIVLVNVLSDNYKSKITINGVNDNRSMTLRDFNTQIVDNNNKIPSNISRVIIYCATWSCDAAKKYYKKLVKNNVNVSKVLYYVGGIHEWASYSQINGSVFTFNSTETGNKLTTEEVNKLLKDTAHDYFVDHVLPESYVKKISVDGKSFKDHL